jgi:hypothetical protein
VLVVLAVAEQAQHQLHRLLQTELQEQLILVAEAGALLEEVGRAARAALV